MEWCLSIAPKAERKIMQEPYPPIIPTKNRRNVANVLPKLDSKMKAANIWEIVIKKPPINIDFLGPNFL